ncbi:MAG: carbamoyl phosphate synthase small subunit [Planctomycetes bacterium SM23_32]|nr:MAG: carbamoyl phosphate synthase small subunit [Planctomycetes bacterium SM23_32]
MKGYLALEDGRVFEGESFAAEGANDGEIVFNTSMTGYQEVLTDPSYKGQIVAMTYPLIGNYGANADDVESAGPQVEGFVVREYCPYPSNFAAEWSLADYLIRHDIIALTEVDTRALTRHVRVAGAMRAVVAAGDHEPDALVERARASPGLIGRDLVREVTCREPYVFAEGRADALHVVVYDFGVKLNILRCLADMGFRVTVLPAGASARDALAHEPDGVLLSNGPGDPEGVPYAVETTRALIGHKPVFGICLGHEFLGLALGGRMRKLKFGHRGANHPVKDLRTGEIDITCQNHSFNVEMDSLDPAEIEITHVNLNDMTAAGLRHRSLPVASVQYHPEASAGPHDARHLFETFKEMMIRERGRSGDTA